MGRTITRLTDRVELARMLPKNRLGAELGVCAGDFSTVLLREAEPNLLYLVDNWARDCLSYAAADAKRLTIERFGEQEFVKIIESESVAWLASLPKSILDWIYLDTLHTERQVTRELCQAFRVVSDGGWICGHDYGPYTPGVVTAVDTFCHLHGQRIAFLTDEPEDQQPGERYPWMPSRAALNSYAIQVEK